MSANWISRKLRRQRPGFSSDTYAHPSVGRYKPPISGPEPVQGGQLTGHSSQPRNRTTVTVKGQNGAKKTVITISKVYSDVNFAGNTPQGATRTSSAPRAKFTGNTSAAGPVGTSTASATTFRDVASVNNPGTAVSPSETPRGVISVRYTDNTATAADKGTSNTVPTGIIHSTSTASDEFAYGRSIKPTTVTVSGANPTGFKPVKHVQRPTEAVNTGVNMGPTGSDTAESLPVAQSAKIVGIPGSGELQPRVVKHLLESQLSSDHPLTIQSEFSFESEIYVDAAESFGIEMPASPSTTVKDDCPQLKSPGSFTQSVESGESLATVIVDDGLSSWGLPKVIEHGYECDEEEVDPEDHSLRYYGIELEPYVAPPSPLIALNRKLSTLLYVSNIVLAHKRQLHQRKQEQKEADLRAKLHFEREKRSRCFPFFASWI